MTKSLTVRTYIRPCVDCGADVAFERVGISGWPRAFICRPCKFRRFVAKTKGKPKVTRTCSHCATSFQTAPSRSRLFCSAECRYRATKRADEIRQCKNCGTDFRPMKANYKKDGQGVYCSHRCRNLDYWRDRKVHATDKDARRHNRHMRRAAMQDVSAEKFTYEEIFERDGWICGICNEPVDPTLKHPDKMFATLDHIVSFVDGGAHTRDNSQLAHWSCNARKSSASDWVPSDGSPARKATRGKNGRWSKAVAD